MRGRKFRFEKFRIRKVLRRPKASPCGKAGRRRIHEDAYVTLSAKRAAPHGEPLAVPSDTIFSHGGINI